MEVDDNNVAYIETVVDDSHEIVECVSEDRSEQCDSANQEINSTANESVIGKNNSAVWTTSATLTLLKLYEAKLEMLETPKKKTRIWVAISENLKEYNIEVTPDQVRWKINALAKKYKQCIDSGQHEKFKYFKEMDEIYAQYNVDCDSYTMQSTEMSQKKKNNRKSQVTTPSEEKKSSLKSVLESKSMIELRKIRLANRIEADRSQSKINLEKQWLEYLRRQEEQKKLRDEIYDRNLRLREEELELRKKELEIMESFEIKKLELKEKEQEEMLQIEREKCEMLKKIFAHQLNDQ